MEDGEVAVLSRGRHSRCYNAMEQPVEKEHHHIDWEISAAEKGGYAHFMLKEIMEQPEAHAPRDQPAHPRGTVSSLRACTLDAGRSCTT